MKIGILECGPTPSEIAARHGRYPDMFARLLDGRGWTFESWAVMDMYFPDGPDAADGWLLTGSRHGAYDALAFIPPLEAFIRACAEQGRPMLGICFGHQIIAQALGGRVEKAAGGWCLGRHVYEFDGHGAVAAIAWHQDQVIEAPLGAEVIARSGSCPLAGLSYPGWAMSVQAHPEFDADIARDFIDLRRDDPAYPPERLASAEAGLDAPIDRDVILDVMGDFLQAALGPPARPAATVRHAAGAKRPGWS